MSLKWYQTHPFKIGCKVNIFFSPAQIFLQQKNSINIKYFITFATEIGLLRINEKFYTNDNSQCADYHYNVFVCK